VEVALLATNLDGGDRRISVCSADKQTACQYNYNEAFWPLWAVQPFQSVNRNHFCDGSFLFRCCWLSSRV